jgi:hypothetical protein
MDAIIHHRRQKRFGKSTIGTKMKINPQSLCIALIIYSTSISAADHSHPISFDTYKVGVATKKSSVLPKTTSADATPYISQLNSAARQPINFAGHYILATWGCGSLYPIGRSRSWNPSLFRKTVLFSLFKAAGMSKDRASTTTSLMVLNSSY